MDRYTGTRHFPCAVCGCESPYRSGWFLVVENSWLDRLRVLSWHPVLAEQSQMLGVCGKHHLKLLITHWLTEASLTCPSQPALGLSPRPGPGWIDADGTPTAAGKLVGELSVHRESSRVWTGSPGTLECILDALISDGETAPLHPAASLLDEVAESYAGYELNEVMTDA